MSTEDPTHVRLPERLLSGSMADLDSGWFIGGHDVKVFPDPEANPVAAAYVRDKLRKGHLEAASPEEHKVVQDSRRAMSQAHVDQLNEHDAHDRYGHQEAALQAIGVDTRKKLDDLRSGTDTSSYEEEEVGTLQSSGGSEGPQDSTVSPTGATKRRTRA